MFAIKTWIALEFIQWMCFLVRYQLSSHQVDYQAYFKNIFVTLLIVLGSDT